MSGTITAHVVNVNLIVRIDGMKKPTRVVMYPQGSPLLLSDIEWNEDGTVKSGYVMNGCWNFEIRNGECLAKNGKHTVNRWNAPEYSVVEIPNDIKGDYNDVINWAMGK